MIIIYASSSTALARDIALAIGIINDCNANVEQATAEIVTYNRKL